MTRETAKGHEGQPAEAPFLVIDGGDACGKGTQVEMLVKRLEAGGYRPHMLDFPRYDLGSSYFADRYLRGHYGKVEEVGAREASIFFALDRYDAKAEIEAAQAEGRVVLANRFSSSNLAHQGSKIEDAGERQLFAEWIEELEFGILGIPRPTVTVVLDVPFEISTRLMAERARREKTNPDIHEQNIRHQRVSRQIYLELCRRDPELFILISCVSEQGELLPPEEIHQLVWRTVEPYLPRETAGN